ncbi:MAG: hypothetical protein Q9217_002280 [Psora testacea]
MSALVAGSRLERLQTRLLQVFVLSVTFFICLAQPLIRWLATEFIGPLEPRDRTSGSDDKASTTVSSTVAQFAPPSRRGEPDSQEWDIETINTYAEAVSGTRPTYLPSGKMPPMPPQATISAALENHRRISVDSGEIDTDEVPAG